MIYGPFQNTNPMTGTITTIQRMSIHDGPGIRSTVFMKGCNLRCKWCHNPETWSRAKQLQHIESKCLHCFSCISVCEQNAISSIENRIKINHQACNTCGKCCEKCPSEALSAIGREVTADSLTEELEKDRVFYETSSGGITISGGEPFMQADFVIELLEQCQKEGLHTAIETNMSMPWESIFPALSHTDLWMCDLKVFDSDKHKYWTGAGNERIMDNLARLAKTGAEMIVRTPVIPGVNDNEYEIKNICGFLKKIGGNVRYELLKFHNLGFGKFDNLGMTNEMDASAHLEDSTFEQLNEIVKSNYFPKP